MKSTIMTRLVCLTFTILLSFASSAQNTFTDADVSDVKTFLHENFGRTNDCMVIGMVDENGSKTFGGGKLDNGTSNQVDGESVFFIGSVTKTFTTLLLQDMADRGEVKLDDPASRYLPKSVTMPTHGGKQITLLNLATHTAGFPHDSDNMSGKGWQEQFETYTVPKMYEYLGNHKLSRDPGAEYEYSNFGIVLLGHILARKAGTNFESLLLDRICRPLRMDDTRIVPTAAMQSHLAMGHNEAGKLYPPAKLDLYAPAGGIHSTAKDMLKYLSAQVGLTSSSLNASMQKTHVIRYKDSHGYPGGTEKNYYGNIAMSWMQRGGPSPVGMELLGHAGGAGSYHCWVGFDLKQRRAVVALTTSARFSIEDVGQAVLRRVSLRDNVLEISLEPVGIGAAVEKVQPTNALRIIKIIPNSPAARAGLSAGLTIEKIDNISTVNKTLVECVNLIRGTPGTTVRLELVDPTLKQTNTIEIVRQKFRV